MQVSNKPSQSQTITMKTRDIKDSKILCQWWKGKGDGEKAEQLISTVAFLRENQIYRQRQAAIYARMYGNMSLYSFIGANTMKMDQSTSLPQDRPTFNVVQSCVDTLVSKVTQSRPSPMFLTDNADYKERNMAKKLNNFVLGEFYQTKAYDKGAIIFRDALVEGTGCMHVYKTPDGKVGAERVLLTELFTDSNESIYGEPRSLYRVKLIDRAVLADMFPKFKSNIKLAEAAYPDNSASSSKTISDLVLVVEGWHLPSGTDAGDGLHLIACSAGVLFEEEWKKDKFPFVFMHFSPRMLGFWAQGLAEQLMGTQMEINSLLYTISRAIKLVGVPRVFQENSSKVNSASHNNDIGVIIKYTGIKPTYEVAPCVPEELYAQLQRLISYAYQQSGVSNLDAGGQKPAGLNSGEAIRTYDDISTDRFAALSRRYDNFYIDLAYQVIELAIEICDEEGAYQTIFPDKHGIKQIDLPKIDMLKNPFIIQCFNSSSLPRDPAGRLSKVTEMIQSGMISIREGRRLLDYPDLSQMETLANAAEERIFQQLDNIVEDGEYSPPDPFTDLQLANDFTVQYINLYSSCKLEEDKMQMLRTYYTQVQTLKGMASQPAPMAPGQPNAPQANPQPLPQSPLVPNGPQSAMGQAA